MTKWKMKIEVLTSCDDQFIERVATKDPFEYWNRCIVPGTCKNSFDNDTKPEGVQVVWKKDVYELINMNYKITYSFDVNVYAHGTVTLATNVAEAIFMYFGYHLCSVSKRKVRF